MKQDLIIDIPAVKEDIDYRLLIENINIGVFRISGHGDFKLLRANNALAAMTGYNFDEVIFSPITDFLFNPDDFHGLLKKVLERGFLKNEQVKLRKKNGEAMWISCAAYAQFKKPGIIECVDGIVEDISERRQSEENLKQGIDRLQKMMEGTIQTIINMIEIRDPYTAGHQRGVRDLACEIAGEMGLSR